MSDTLYEYYDTGDDSSASVVGVTWRTQTFTVGTVGANEDHDITSVKLLLYRSGSPGTVTVSIRATDRDGKPTGSDLTNGETDGDTLPTGSPYEWREITLKSCQLRAKTKYAIVVRAPHGDVINCIYWRGDRTSPTYTGGSAGTSSDSGSTWTMDTTTDYLFEEYGIPAGEALTQDLSETLTLSESIKHDFGLNRTGALAETLTLAEAIKHGIGVNLTGASAEVLTLAETLKHDIGVKPSDSLTMTEALTSETTFNVALDDTITFAEALVAAQGFHLSLADTVTLAEGLVAAQSMTLALSDTLNLSETLKHDISMALADTEALAESIATQTDFNVAVTDTLALSESLAHAISTYLTETLDLDEELSAELEEALKRMVKGAMARKIGQPTPINIGMGM